MFQRLVAPVEEIERLAQFEVSDGGVARSNAILGEGPPQPLRSFFDAVELPARHAQAVVQCGKFDARKSGIAESDLRRANPQVKGDLIHIGDKLNLVVPDPYLNLASTETYVYKQAISYPTQVQNDVTRWPWERIVTQAGRSGQKEVTVEIQRVNGEEVSRKLINETLLSSPVTQVVIQGTKIVPDQGTGTLIWPAVGPINSPYGYRGREFHDGIDIGAPRGSAVMAADSGMVTEARYAGNYGNCVRIDHGGGSMVTLYAHLSQILVKVGDVVTKGQVIGKVGSTGRSTGNHLHYEVRINGKQVNPIQFYPGK